MAGDPGSSRERFLQLFVGSVFLLVVLEHAVGPWIWIASRGTSASAWGTAAAPGPAREPTESFGRELLGGRGRALSAVAVLFGAPLLWMLEGSRESLLDVLVCYTMCWLPSAILLIWAWGRLGKRNGVHPGLMANFFLSGAILGCAYAAFFEILEEMAWQMISPSCTAGNFDVGYTIAGQPFPRPMTVTCGISVAGMWILTPGLIEETGKAIWLFLRLRKSLGDLPETCFGCLPANTSRVFCGWFKLAPTPYHVLLCSLAGGAGFECLENMKYVFSPSDRMPQESPVEVVFARALSSNLHMMWTGLIGLGLARRMFPSGGPGSSLLCVVMPSVVLHGLFDFGITLIQNVASRADRRKGMMDRGEAGELVHTHMDSGEASELLFLATALIVLASAGGWLALGMLTRRSRSCCFAPDFFDSASAARGCPAADAAARRPLLLAA
ncbi:unnamed protein product [Prorocentrum cordatum]|uniref:PrsW family intramembrane metalloprotease n=2 Tax=Prorocentrum cordatum TaxID=2364126 RepID=A0ABN9VWK3_9DINO|nr:unnamed protein product [Polarella glacialis]